MAEDDLHPCENSRGSFCEQALSEDFMFLRFCDGKDLYKPWEGPVHLFWTPCDLEACLEVGSWWSYEPGLEGRKPLVQLGSSIKVVLRS